MQYDSPSSIGCSNSKQLIAVKHIELGIGINKGPPPK